MHAIVAFAIIIFPSLCSAPIPPKLLILRGSSLNSLPQSLWNVSHSSSVGCRHRFLSWPASLHSSRSYPCLLGVILSPLDSGSLLLTLWSSSIALDIMSLNGSGVFFWIAFVCCAFLLHWCCNVLPAFPLAASICLLPVEASYTSFELIDGYTFFDAGYSWLNHSCG